MPETVGGVVRNRDFVVLKSQNFFPVVFVGDSYSRKFPAIV